MKRLLIVIAAVAGLVVGLMLLGSGDDESGQRGISRWQPGAEQARQPTPSPTSTPSQAAISSARFFDGTPPASADRSSVPTIASGPYLVASNVLGDPTIPSNDQRVFRHSDGTIVVLYHRPGGLRGELQEIVMVHSHDEGQSWHGELTVGAEAAEAVYAGVMDPQGNLHVVYGREAVGALAGAIKLRTLPFRDQLHGWDLAPEHRIVWDWPGQGAGAPVLELTGTRLWLAYRLYDGGDYSLVVRYADPESTLGPGGPTL